MADMAGVVDGMRAAPAGRLMGWRLWLVGAGQHRGLGCRRSRRRVRERDHGRDWRHRRELGDARGGVRGGHRAGARAVAASARARSGNEDVAPGMTVHWRTAQARHIGRLGARLLVAPSLLLATAMAPSASAQQGADASTVREAPATQGHNEVDRFMKSVFDNRDETWQRLGDFILRETNTFEPEAPAGIPLSGYRRDSRPRTVTQLDRQDAVATAIEQSWSAQVSEPLRQRIAADANLLGDDVAAVTLNTGAILEDLGGVEQVGFGTAVTRTADLLVMRDAGRLTATEVGRAMRRPLASLVDWIDLARPDELARLDELRRRLETGSGVEETGDGGDMDGTVLLDTNRLEPRFVVESSYFWHQFTFEPGSYYFAGRDTVAGREVLRIEYYPTDSFDEEYDAKINRGFNKTSTITFWIDPEVHQIVRHTLDNSGLDFLPLRWLLRVDGLEASTEMAPVGDVWLPSRVTASGSVTTALGEFQVSFTTEFFDYREAETSSRLIGPRSPR